MKKLSPLLLVSALTLLLTACGGSSDNTSSDSRDTGNASRVMLSWIAPTSRTDGSYLPVNDLEGYRIYYGRSASDLTMLVDLNDDTATEYTVDSLPSGNYYFAVTAYDTNGAESGFSNVINKDV